MVNVMRRSILVLIVSLNFSLTAPNNPGQYMLKYGTTARLSCDGSTPRAPIEVGLIIVQ